MANEINKIIENSDYRNLLKEISYRANIELETYINTQIINIAQKKVNSSALPPEMLSELLLSEKEHILNYSVEILNTFKNIELEEEYPTGEEIEETQEDREVETLSIISLIGFLIEYYFLSKNDINSLDKYLNKIRSPNRKKYIKQLQEIYEKAINKV
ncbi:hypothetical protein [Riemerella columbina]|uniref:hypothetical protein n=1 Tax=Riemerella columbina TaxID=103810 RepID=UPI002670A562|nr:hypothetical protein [Riemerella columbina]WKS94555.1 hypothetical protein NYR17_06360 [Riemerella columbina]